MVTPLYEKKMFRKNILSSIEMAEDLLTHGSGKVILLLNLVKYMSLPQRLLIWCIFLFYEELRRLLLLIFMPLCKEYQEEFKGVL